jgi:Holliday junction resolvasome RuvABC endonuclease subunit
MAKRKWVELDLAALPNCRFIACDPSLAATGLVFIEVHDGEVYVVGSETIGAPKTELVGWEDTFLRAHQLKTAMRAVMEAWVHDYGVSVGVHEAPPVGGSNMMRTESTILAGYDFEQIAEELGMDTAPLVTPNAHKFLLCGNGRATKKEHHEKIKELLPSIFDGKLVTNEGQRDALSVALYAAHRLGEQRNGS